MALVLFTIWVLSLIEARAAPVPSIVFLGDSIVHAGPWTKLCRGAVIIAQPSGTTRDMLRLVPRVLDAKPATVVIMAGVNDIALDIPEDETIANLDRAVSELRASGARVILHSILPVTEAYPRPGYNARISAINARLPADRVVVSIALRDYMGDGIHLRPNAYRAWASHLQSENACR